MSDEQDIDEVTDDSSAEAAGDSRARLASDSSPDEGVEAVIGSSPSAKSDAADAPESDRPDSEVVAEASGEGDAGPLSANNLATVEAVIFAAEEPVSLELIGEILELATADVQRIVDRLREDCAREGRGLRLTRVAGGYRFVTRPDYHPWVRLLFRNRRTVRLSRAALQTLAIIAYKQPVTGPEIEEIRSVDSSGMLRNLLEKRLVKIIGRKDVVGRPLLYGTTQEFLIHFGLESLDDLPSLQEFEQLIEADLGESATVNDADDDPNAEGEDGDASEVDAMDIRSPVSTEEEE